MVSQIIDKFIADTDNKNFANKANLYVQKQ